MNGRGSTPTGRGIEYSSSNYGECSWKSSQGLDTSSGKWKEIMEGIQSGISQSVITITTGGYFAIQISSQTTKKDVSEIPLLRTIIPRKFLSFCDTITFAPVQSQVLRNSRTWYNRKTFPITTISIHCLRLTLHRKLFAANPSSQRLSESTQNSIDLRYKI